MNNLDIHKAFNKNKKYRKQGFLFIMLATFPASFLDGTLRILLTSIFLIIAFVLYRNYRCPVCKHVFDPRVKDIKHCSNCGVKLKG